MRNLFLVVLVLLIAAAGTVPATAQEGPYHQWLRSHLDADYGIAGGTWLLGETESEVLALADVSSGVSRTEFTLADLEFSRALRLIVTQPTANSWERTVRFNTQAPVQEGDALLLVMWLRHTWPVDEEGLVEPVFEQTTTPYTKSLQQAYNVSSDWSLYLVPFQAVESHPQGGARFQLNMGRQRQITELGGLALLNYGSSMSVADLPTVVPRQGYGGQSPEASWRSEAQTRIEQHRKGTFRIAVVDESGRPVPDMPVLIQMKRHAFGFGTAVATGRMIGGGADETYKDKLEDLTGDGRTFNIAVLENALKWGPWETGWPVSKSLKTTAVAWLNSRGMDVRGHALVWPGWEYLPGDLYDRRNDPTYVSDRIRSHIHELAGYRGLKGVIQEWDVINEPAHVTDLRDQVFRGTAGNPTGEEVYAQWFEWAAEADPDARLFINDYGIISSYGPTPEARSRYKSIIGDLVDAGAPLHGIGMQGHMGNPLTPIDTVYQVIDDFAQFGHPISITEYDAAGVEEDLAADYLRDFLTIVYSHPSVESFLMWGFWDGAHWLDDAPLFRQDWSLKPSGDAFLDLVFHEWWTDVRGRADDAGMWIGSGFAGTYDVSVEIMDAAARLEVDLTPGDTTEVTLTVISTGIEAPDAHAFVVEPNFPNPVYNRTTVTYVLPRPEAVVFEIFDVAGRRVHIREVGAAAAGRHAVDLDVRGLSSGTYFYRIRAGEYQHTGHMSVIR